MKVICRDFVRAWSAARRWRSSPLEIDLGHQRAPWIRRTEVGWLPAQIHSRRCAGGTVRRDLSGRRIRRGGAGHRASVHPAARSLAQCRGTQGSEDAPAGSRAGDEGCRYRLCSRIHHAERRTIRFRSELLGRRAGLAGGGRRAQPAPGRAGGGESKSSMSLPARVQPKSGCVPNQPSRDPDSQSMSDQDSARSRRYCADPRPSAAALSPLSAGRTSASRRC